MNKNLIDENKYQKILNLLEKEIKSKEFERNLKSVHDIDLNHYTKRLIKTEIIDIIEYYKTEKIIDNEFNKILVLLPGNPEIVLKLCLEAVRHDLDLVIGIEDFCLAQNRLIVETFLKIFNDINFKRNIEIKNLLKDSEIIGFSNKTDKTIIIGNSNLYNRLENDIKDLELNTYGIFEVYSDSKEFYELEQKIYECFEQNEFEIEYYDDLEIEQAIKIINKNGYHFCSILFSNNKENQKKFKEHIDSEYVIINKNPFKEIKFRFKIS